MTEKIEAAIATICKDLFNTDVRPELKRTDEQFGDYSCNVAMQLASQLNKNPKEIAESLAQKLSSDSGDQIKDVSVAGPGFLNITLTDQALYDLATNQPAKSMAGKVVVAEYSDPNPFKVLHAGHLYTSVVGDAISNLLETVGAKVHRVNFGGDVGLHVGKTMWAVLQRLSGENPDRLKDIPQGKRSEWMAEAYVDGTNAYEDDEQAKQNIIQLNKRVYQIFADDDHDSAFAQIYWTCRDWSYEYFDKFYASIGTKFDKYYPESDVADLGLKTVKEQLEKGVFVESDGAVIFPGEKYDLHTRVFINSQGLPTYEAKDVGLSIAKWQDYHFDESVIITGNEIEQYMQVILKAIEQFEPALSKATIHIPHGMVKLQGGVKMSSRKGNILRAVDILEIANEAAKKVSEKENPQTVLAAVKYAFLKQRIGGDIIYDPEESVSVQGNSGPYLQYAHARASSILRKASTGDKKSDASDLQPAERSLLRKIGEYSEVVDRAVQELMPHNIAGYLYELAQSFNSFYENNRVIGDAREQVRLVLVKKYIDVLKSGLNLLGISAPDEM